MPKLSRVGAVALAALSVVVAALVTPMRAGAENLNQKYGPSWSCRNITAGMPIYNPCVVCERQNMDFYRDTETTGHCEPRASGSNDPGYRQSPG